MRQFISRINWLELKKLVWRKFKDYLLFLLIVWFAFLFGLVLGIDAGWEASQPLPEVEDSYYYDHQPFKRDNINEQRRI